MILIIDNYDSFTYNLVQLVGSMNPDVTVVRNDAVTVDDIKALSPSHIILSPGPGYPKDAGVCEEAVRHLGGIVPVLGVCLGHQAICEVFGAAIARAKKLGVAGKHIELMEEVVSQAKRHSAKPVDIDMLGAIGATMMDLGFTPEATWAILAVTRAFAAGAHYIEEVEREGTTRLGETLTPKEFYDGPADRPVPPLAEGRKNAKPAQTFTPDEWKKAFEERQKMYGTGYRIVEEIEDPSKKTGVKSTGR